MEITKDEFAAEVRKALEHLYDVAVLPGLQLVTLLPGYDALSWDKQAQSVRRLLVEAIEHLDPGLDVPLRARERRTYAILSGRYCSRRTPHELMGELALSERQYWRESSRAIKTLVDLLWADCSRRASTPPSKASHTPKRDVLAQEEAGLLVSYSIVEEVNAGETVRGVEEALQKVLDARDIHLLVDIADPPPLVRADRAALRQLCLNLISFALRATTNAHVSVLLDEQAASVRLAISAAMRTSDAEAEDSSLQLKVARRLVEGQGGHLFTSVDREGQWVATAMLPRAARIPVLVIDDNRAIVGLFRRYLAASKYEVIAAHTGQRAVELAEQRRPAVITLDVMMPGQDGWEVLQALKTSPELCTTPVVVCSILDEPQLALSLGADGFICKPVTQAGLLQTLDRLALRGLEPPVHPTGPVAH